MAFDSLPEAEKGYLAGLIDGEAYIGITKSIRKDNGRVRYAPSFRIRMTDYAIVKSLHYRRGRKKRTDAEIQAAELLYQKMRKLNKRGK